jgi:hypothetical protein
VATATPFRIPVADLLKRPGAARPIEVAAPVRALVAPGAEIPADAPVEIDATLERVSDGIVVRGEVRARWTRPAAAAWPRSRARSRSMSTSCSSRTRSRARPICSTST